jgi:NAD(P)-dependent dehydrogenase (short-subunit alcohol dehydrogenase family)
MVAIPASVRGDGGEVMIRFGEEHLRLFSTASLDLSPIHLSEAYARKSAIGERAVYGVLGVLAGLSQMGARQGKVISRVTVQYHAPLLLHVDYNAELSDEPDDAVSLSLMDGSILMLRARFQMRPGQPVQLDIPASCQGLGKSRVLTAEKLTSGLVFRGKYNPPLAAYQELLALLGLNRAMLGDFPLILLLSSSYLTGMELPGERSLALSLSAEINEALPTLPLDFEISLCSRDERFGLLRSEFRLFHESETYAAGMIGAVSPPVRTGLVGGFPDVAQEFAGKTALVIGASRGLGAAMTLYLVSAGASVLGTYARSREDAEALMLASRNRPGRLLLEQGDASDLEWCRLLKRRVLKDLGRLDLLVCNAAPAIGRMKLEEAYFRRLLSYLQHGISLVGAPLSVFLVEVASVKGSVLLLSSSAVESVPRNQPQYVVLKAAAEHLVRAAAVEYPEATFWIARPSAIRTDLINTPVGWLKAEEPNVVARRILEQVAGSSEDGGVHFCH